MIGWYRDAQAIGENLGRARIEGGRADRARFGLKAEKESERILERKSSEKRLRRVERKDVVMKSMEMCERTTKMFRLRQCSVPSL